MNPPFNTLGNPRPERRRSSGRRSEDELSSEILLGYERWAGAIWRHRGKVAAMIGMTGSLVGCVVGYVGRAHDLDDVRSRLVKVEQYQEDQVKTEALKMSMLCSLMRRIDPLGTPVECGTMYSPPRGKQP